MDNGVQTGFRSQWVLADSVSSADATVFKETATHGDTQSCRTL